MSPPSSITALAEQHRRDLINQAETYRLARAARNNRPAPTRHMPRLPQELAAGVPAAGSRTCHHFPPCPAATASDRHAARTIAAHPEQGWSLLCNGVVLFDDNGELLPGGCAVIPLPRMTPNERAAACGQHRTRRPECDAAAYPGHASLHVLRTRPTQTP